MRAWLALKHAGAEFETRTVSLDDMGKGTGTELRRGRRQLGSVAGLFPVLWVGGVPIHEALAICEWTAETYPQARLWPSEPLERARARAVAAEMAAGFAHLRANLSCHVFARVPAFVPDAPTQAEIERIFELWSECLERSGGPFLFGEFSVADAMYFPVLTRFVTYQIAIPDTLRSYSAALDEHPAVVAWRAVARAAPRMSRYDRAIRDLGGDPDAALS